MRLALIATAFLLAATSANAQQGSFEGTWDTVWTDPSGGVSQTEFIITQDNETDGIDGVWDQAGLDGVTIGRQTNSTYAGTWVQPTISGAGVAGSFSLTLTGACSFAGAWMTNGSTQPGAWTGTRRGCQQ